MPDWRKLVGERMSALNLPPEAKEEVISELAAHLEDGYQNEIAHGLGESEASQHVLSEVQWSKLAREIPRAARKEESMNNRARVLWLPAVVNLAVAAVLLIIVVELGADARMTRSGYYAVVRLSLHHRDHVGFLVLIYNLLDLLGMVHLSWLLYPSPFGRGGMSYG